MGGAQLEATACCSKAGDVNEFRKRFSLAQEKICADEGATAVLREVLVLMLSKEKVREGAFLLFFAILWRTITTVS